ncbi:MAG: ammonium transporter, partial [Rhizobiales bacterium]|nr:ammonium transporter [Hyphomicrobiales bacterium]
TSAGNDLYHPIQAMLIGAIVPCIAYKLHYYVERRFKIDDAVGAVAVHGYGGFLGVVVAGFMLWGQPSSPYEGYAAINPLGNFIGALIMVALGFIPTFIVVKILSAANLLRVPKAVEIVGLDFATREAYEAAVADVTATEKAMVN